MVGNPNHDPNTGRFTSGSGLNKSNSTLGQRGKAKIKEHISDAKAYALGAAGVAVAGIGAAILQGVTKPTRIHATHIANAVIKAGISKGNQIAAAHGPTVSKALREGTSTLMAHVRNMKRAGVVQHQAPYTPGPSKPRVRVPAGRQVVPPAPAPRSKAPASRRRK